MNPDQLQNINPAMTAGIGIGIFVVYIAIWVFFAFCMAKLGEKLGQPFGTGFIMSIIPIVNFIFLLQLAKKPLWWIILMIIPIVNIVILAIVWMSICEQRGKPKWWGLLMFVPIANLVVFLMLAFGQ